MRLGTLVSLLHEINWDRYMTIKAMKKARKGSKRGAETGEHRWSADDPEDKVMRFASLINRR